MSFPQKPADTDLPIIDVIKNRWSPVSIGPKPIEQRDIDTLFEAARWAPSSYNEQPWRYVYATKDDPNREQLESLLTDGNAWAKNAYVLICSFTSTKLARNGKENTKALHDLGAANLSIALQATSMGLESHQMGGFYADKANETLGVPEEFVPGSMMAVGYPDENASEEQKERDAGKRERKERSEFVFKVSN